MHYIFRQSITFLDICITFWDKCITFLDKCITFWDKWITFWGKCITYWGKCITFWGKCILHHLCVLRLELVLKPLLHSGQIWGFSPVWVLMCLLRRLGLSNVFPHTVHGNMVFSLGLLPGPVLKRHWFFYFNIYQGCMLRS